MKNKPLKYTLDELTDKHIGKIGTPKRDAFENKLRLDLQSKTTKQINNKQDLSLKSK